MHGPTGIFWANLTPFSLQWLTDHCEDPTADGPLTIAQAKKALKPKLTPEPQAAEALGKGSKAAAAPAGSSDMLAFGTGPPASQNLFLLPIPEKNVPFPSEGVHNVMHTLGVFSFQTRKGFVFVACPQHVQIQIQKNNPQKTVDVGKNQASCRRLQLRSAPLVAEWSLVPSSVTREWCRRGPARVNRFWDRVQAFPSCRG